MSDDQRHLVKFPFTLRLISWDESVFSNSFKINGERQVAPGEHVDLTGKTIVVVGTTVGLGFEAAPRWTQRGWFSGVVAKLGEDVPTPSLVNSSRGADYFSCRHGKFTASPGLH